jgi:hypothetical protein
MYSSNKKICSKLLFLAVSMFLFVTGIGQNLTGPVNLTTAVNQTDLNQSHALRFFDSNIPGSNKQFLLIGRHNDIPYFRTINNNRIRFIGNNGSVNAEITETGIISARNAVSSRFFIQQAGLIDAAYSATASISGGSLGSGGPHLKTSSSHWECTALNQSITFDMRVQAYVTYITFAPYHGSDARYIPRGYIISTSDDNITYTDRITVTNNTTLLPFHEMPTTAARYWRLTVTEFQPGYNVVKISGVQILTGTAAATSGNYWGNRYGTSSIFFRGAGVGIDVVDVPNGYKLAVNGASLFTSVRVRSYANWPDYVFEPNYQLPSLKETEAFILANKHLPGITPAAKANADGIDLADEQAALLKQIEEMMLHLIKQEKKIEELQKEINLLKQK